MNRISIALHSLMAVTTVAALGADPATPAPPPAPVVVGTATNDAAPKIQFATPIYDFGRAKAGEVLKFDFVFTNVGNALLELTAVKPGCGCTTAGEWSRKVEPGQTGRIPIQFNAGEISGPVAKGVAVTCNDKSQPTVSLQIKGTVWKPVEVIPQYAIFRDTAEALSIATSIVRIVNNEETPVTLSAPEINNSVFAAAVKTNVPGKEYQVVIRLTKPLETGNAVGVITIKTSSTNAPVASIHTMAYLQPTIVATPATVSLPGAPITNELPVTVSIRIGEDKPTKLRAATINGKNVDVKVTEVEPGRSYSVKMTFPAGFEIAQGENVELSVAMDNPQFPTVIKVPISQPRSATP